jgi:hypothetical protein
MISALGGTASLLLPGSDQLEARRVWRQRGDDPQGRPAGRFSVLVAAPIAVTSSASPSRSISPCKDSDCVHLQDLVVSPLLWDDEEPSNPILDFQDVAGALTDDHARRHGVAGRDPRQDGRVRDQ